MDLLDGTPNGSIAKIWAGFASDDGASEGTIWDVLDAIAAAREAAESTEDELYTGDERVDETSVETASSVPVDERQCDGTTRYWSMYSRFDMDVFVDADTFDEAKVKCAKWLIENGTAAPNYDTVECPDDCPPGATGCEIVPMSSDTYTADDGRFYCPKASEHMESSVVYWTCSECVADDCPGAGDSSDASSETVGTDTPMEESPSAGMDTDLSGNPFIDHDYNGRFNAGDERVSLTTEIDSGGDVISIYRGTGKMIIPKTTPTPCGEADPALVFEAEDILVRKRLSCAGSVGFVAEDMLRIRTGRDQSIGGDLDIRARRMVAQDTAIDAGAVSIQVDGKLDLSGAILMAQGGIVLSGKNIKLLEATVWSEDDWVDINATGAHINLRDLLVSDAGLQTCHTLSGACPDAVYVRWADLDAGLFTIDGVCPTDAGGLTFVGEAGGYSCAAE